MFKSARIKLTAWYLLIIFLISFVFSFAFYHSMTRDIDHFIKRLEIDKEMQINGTPLYLPPKFRNAPTLEELQEAKRRSILALIGVNGFIIILAGYASYFLAGKTLSPIENMVCEQNTFVSNASHELRTPLATLRAEMEGQLLEKSISDSMARKLIQSNLEELQTLQNLTTSLLKINHSHTLLRPASSAVHDLSKIIKLAIKKIELLAKQKRITIKTDLGNSIKIKAQAELIVDSMVIILENAIKYSRRNSIITVRSNKIKNIASVSISDTGIGIAEDDLPHIFERFYRADKSRSSTEGFGLGLSIAKTLILSQRGQIKVESALGKGSTFTLVLPVPVDSN